MGGSGPICLPTSSHLRQSGGEVARESFWLLPGWPNMPWFWDLVAMSSQIPLSLPNLLTQPFNQTQHRNLSNLNLHAWLSNQVDFMAPPIKSVADFLMHLFQDRKLLPSTTDGYTSAIGDKLGIHPLISTKMKKSLISWIVSKETDPKDRGKSPPGTCPWFCTS